MIKTITNLPTTSIFFLIFFAGISLYAQQKTALLSDELPGGPPNAAAEVVSDNNGKSLVLIYNQVPILKIRSSQKLVFSSTFSGDKAIEQRIDINISPETKAEATIYASSEANAAETRGQAQEKFPLVRTSHGLSNNLRNNAVYDRNFDWLLEMPEGTLIHSERKTNGTTEFHLVFTGKEVQILFRPRYYQKHKNLPYFQPWTYRVFEESVTGWSSWWAYRRDFDEQKNNELLKVWQEKKMADYGYHFIQIDDVYQGGNDQGRQNCALSHSYNGGRPTTWLDWKKDLFPGGLQNYVASVNKAGFDPAVWMGCFFSDDATVQEHPDWFVHDKNGKPAAAPWVSYVADATNPEAVEALIRPTFRGLKDAGVKYVKIDQLRHYLYDNLNKNTEWLHAKGMEPADMIRAYLHIAREELDDETFLLSCWGVLPESIGIADACRIGGDGYGPVTLQQYNSWNGIVWRNDPDHCDISPVKQAREVGNVRKLEARKSLPRESIIRPALASIAGAMLMLSDKAEVYENDELLKGVRRSVPVLFSVPGQLYDFDPSKTDRIKTMKRTDIKSGTRPSPIDGDQLGEVCHYWLNEFNTGYEDWCVLHRLNWSDNSSEFLPTATVKFADLGLDPSKKYLVYEFWDDKFMGVLSGEFSLGELQNYGLESLAIREKQDRPQLVSTNRHLSQGAAEIEMLRYDKQRIIGRSRVVAGDEYIMTFYIPESYRFVKASVDGKIADTEQERNLLKIKYLPATTASVKWKIEFEK